MKVVRACLRVALVCARCQRTSPAWPHKVRRHRDSGPRSLNGAPPCCPSFCPDS